MKTKRKAKLTKIETVKEAYDRGFKDGYFAAYSTFPNIFHSYATISDCCYTQLGGMTWT